PYTFDISVREIFWTLTVGATLVIAHAERQTDPEYLSQVCRDARVTHLHFVPSMLQVFLEYVTGELPSLRQVISCGEALPVELMRRFLFRFPRVQLLNFYGPTETTIDVSHHRCRGDETGTFVTLGLPMPNVQMLVLDERLFPAPAGTPGELHI